VSSGTVRVVVAVAYGLGVQLRALGVPMRPMPPGSREANRGSTRDATQRVPRRTRVRRLLPAGSAGVFIAALASGCLGSSTTSSAPSRTTPTLVGSQAGWDRISVPNGLTIRYPPAWYGQTYLSGTATISSFPIHQPGHAVAEKPPGGALVLVFDSPPPSPLARYLPPRPSTPLRLGHFSPSYEMFGAAYRIAFHDRGHHVLVFVAVGKHATATTRQDAVAVLNSIHAQEGTLPPPPERQAVTLHLGSGQRTASALVIYPHFGQTFTITTTKPASTRLSGFVDAGGMHFSAIAFTTECTSRIRRPCQFAGLEQGAVPRIWYLRISKHSTPPATVHIVVRFR
jgi:hypothetical protein